MTKADTCARYCADMAWSLVTIPAGSKAPRAMGWQRPEQAISTADAAREYWTANPDHNVGLLHSASGTVALDIDNVEWTRIIFEGLGLDYDALMASAPRIVGRRRRARAPVDAQSSRPESVQFPGDADVECPFGGKNGRGGVVHADSNR